MIVFLKQKVFNADNYFIENLELSRNPCFCHPGSYCYQSVTLGRNVGKVTLWIKYKIYILEVLTVFQFMPTLYRDHEKFGKSTTIFTETFIRTLAILRVDKHFCFSVLFNNCFPFSIKKSLKYNTVQLVVNKVPKFPWFCKHFKDGFMKTSTAEI